jgi:hypothetical protein
LVNFPHHPRRIYRSSVTTITFEVIPQLQFWYKSYCGHWFIVLGLKSKPAIPEVQVLPRPRSEPVHFSKIPTNSPVIFAEIQKRLEIHDCPEFSRGWKTGSFAKEVWPRVEITWGDQEPSGVDACQGKVALECFV